MEYELKLSDQEVTLIWNALSNANAGQVRALMNKLEMEISRQQQALKEESKPTGE